MECCIQCAVFLYTCCYCCCLFLCSDIAQFILIIELGPPSNTSEGRRKRQADEITMLVDTVIGPAVRHQSRAMRVVYIFCCVLCSLMTS